MPKYHKYSVRTTRQANYSAEEEEELVRLGLANWALLQNPSSRIDVLVAKEEKWQEIAKSLNDVFAMERTADTVRVKYRMIKKSVRAKHLYYKRAKDCGRSADPPFKSELHKQLHAAIVKSSSTMKELAKASVGIATAAVTSAPIPTATTTSAAAPPSSAVATPAAIATAATTSAATHIYTPSPSRKRKRNVERYSYSTAYSTAASSTPSSICGTPPSSAVATPASSAPPSPPLPAVAVDLTVASSAPPSPLLPAIAVDLTVPAVATPSQQAASSQTDIPTEQQILLKKLDEANMEIANLKIQLLRKDLLFRDEYNAMLMQQSKDKEAREKAEHQLRMRKLLAGMPIYVVDDGDVIDATNDDGGDGAND